MEDMENEIREIAPTVVPTFEVVIDSGAPQEVQALCEAYWGYAEESGAGGTPLKEDYLREEGEVLEGFREEFSEAEAWNLIKGHSKGVLRVNCYNCGTTLEATGSTRSEVEQALTNLGLGIKGLGATPEKRADMAQERQDSGAADPRETVLCSRCLADFQERDVAYLAERRMGPLETQDPETQAPPQAGGAEAAQAPGPIPESPIAGEQADQTQEGNYRILQAPVDQPEKLEKEMARFIASGFHPCGGPQVATMGSRVVLLQAAYRSAGGTSTRQ
jgi:hypothetical protein